MDGGLPVSGLSLPIQALERLFPAPVLAARCCLCLIEHMGPPTRCFPLAPRAPSLGTLSPQAPLQDARGLAPSWGLPYLLLTSPPPPPHAGHEPGVTSPRFMTRESWQKQKRQINKQ